MPTTQPDLGRLILCRLAGVGFVGALALRVGAVALGGAGLWGQIGVAVVGDVRSRPLTDPLILRHGRLPVSARCE